VVLQVKPTLSFMVSKGSPVLELMNNAMRHILEEGTYMYINNRVSDKTVINTKCYHFAVTFYAISNRHLQTALYLMMLGFVLSVVCLFYDKIMWHR
jgi:hypothetical protein